ncbi:MAG: PrpF domain-containing protein [Microbacterium sp.]
MTTAADGIPCLLMRGGTSKGAYFLASDLPDDPAERDELLLRVMGSPDPRQIDGLGGAHPLTSKVAIVSPSAVEGVDVDYLFLQIGVDQPTVSDAQTCGNLLAGVGPFAIERGLMLTTGDRTSVTIRLVNTGDVATTTIPTGAGVVDYDGDRAIDGVPGTACAIDLDVAGQRAILPTGHTIDVLDGHDATLVDNGMPVVLLRAAEFGVTGAESPFDLEERTDLVHAVERIRRLAGPLFGLGDVADQSVPKVFLLSPPTTGGDISTRAFIPHRVHTSIGVLMAASVAAGVLIPGTVAHAAVEGDTVLIEHASGTFPAQVSVRQTPEGWLGSSVSERTARKIFDGRVFPRPRL